MFEAVSMMGMFAACAYFVRRAKGGAIKKWPAAVALGVTWLALLWLLGSTGGTGGPGWLHAGVIIAFMILTSGSRDEPRENHQALSSESPRGESGFEGSVPEAHGGEVAASTPGPVEAGPEPTAQSTFRFWMVVSVASILFLSVIFLPSRGPTSGDPRPGGGSTAERESRSQSIWDAAFSGDAQAVIDHVGRGVSPDARDADGNTPLIVAAAAGRGSIVRLLLEMGGDPNETGLFETVPLAEAAARGNHEMARVLLDHGALPNAQGTLGWAPLHFAVFNGDVAMAELLLDGGADPRLPDVNGVTPVTIAVFEENRTIIDLVLQRARR
jgi:uncharacterized protein